MANANPAVVDTARMSRIEIAQISVEFSSSRQTGSSVNSCPQLTGEWPLCLANSQQFKTEQVRIRMKKQEMSLPWSPMRAEIRRIQGVRCAHEENCASY